MPVDKSWMHLRTRNCPEYEAGVKKFIQKARLHVNEEGKICCPCVRCYNGKWFKPDLVEIHCLLKGFSKTYQKWYFHGEEYGTNVSDEDDDKDEEDEKMRWSIYYKMLLGQVLWTSVLAMMMTFL